MTTRKRSAATTVGKHVELASGDTILVRAWGWDHIAQNTSVLTDIIVGTFNALAESSTDEETGNALRDALTKNLQKLRGLVVASLENGEDDLAKLQGFGDVVSVLDAVIEANELIEALAKGRARYRALMEALNPAAKPMEETTNPA